MLSLMWYLRDRLCYLRDQRGIETLEWVLIGALVSAAAIGIYATLEGGLSTAVDNITTFIGSTTDPST